MRTSRRRAASRLTGHGVTTACTHDRDGVVDAEGMQVIGLPVRGKSREIPGAVPSGVESGCLAGVALVLCWPAHVALLSALDRGCLTVGQLAEAVGTS